MDVVAYPLNRKKYFAEDAAAFNATRTNGVYSRDDDYIVTAGTGYAVVVSTGLAWMRTSRFSGAVFVSREDIELIPEIADAYFPRVDRIVLRIDYVSDAPVVTIKTGEPAANPVGAAITRDEQAFELAVADITIPAGATTIAQGNINDLRLDESLCGIMADGVTRIPTQALYDAWWAWFSALKGNADQQAQEFLVWMEFFRNQHETEFAQWVTDRQQEITEWMVDFKNEWDARAMNWYNGVDESYSALINSWYTGFTSGSEDDFNAWFADIKAVLDANAAGELYNKIDRHEKMIISEDAVHGLRFVAGALQVYFNGGWLTVGEVTYGMRVGYIESLQLTRAEIESKQLTCYQIEVMAPKED